MLFRSAERTDIYRRGVDQITVEEDRITRFSFGAPLECGGLAPLCLLDRA